MDVPLTVLVFAGLLLLAGLMEPLASRFRLPSTVFLAMLGILVAAGSAQLLQIAPGSGSGIARAVLDIPIGSAGFIYVFLPVLLFQAALNIDVRQMAEDVVTVLTLAVLAVVIATFMIGLALSPTTGVPLLGCLLLGAIVATTDPGAVIGIFRDAGAPQRLSRLVEGESLLNDAAAVVLFEIFIAQLVAPVEADLVHLVSEFFLVPAGGAAVGYGLARLCAMLFGLVGNNRLVLVSVTMALPFAAMIIAALLGLSGFVAVVSAGIALAALGPPRSAPESWRHLRDIWEQLAFWASSLLFVLAAFLIPTLMEDMGLADLAAILIVVAMALASRAVVLFGLLPILTATGLSPHVSLPYKAVILWGGLRGAATLALALAVTEHPGLPPEIQRFVAVVATGFVLFTLLVQGVTLRPLMRWLGLDRLTPLENALRDHAVALVASHVQVKVEQAAESFGLPHEAAHRVAHDYLQRLQAAGPKESGIALEDRITLALAAVSSRENEIILVKLTQLLIGPQNASVLLAQTRKLLDAARAEGPSGYSAVAEESLAFPWQIRFAHWAHQHLGVSAFLRSRLADRFEVLVASRSVMGELKAFPRASIAPLFGSEVSSVTEAILGRRLEGIVRELDALRLQYPAYAEKLYGTLLVRSGLQMEEAECERLHEEGLISLEVRRAILEQIAAVRAETTRRPMLDLQLDTLQLARGFPLFESFDDDQLAGLARLLRPVTALPGQQIIRKGERGDACFFIASGAVEVDIGSSVVRLGRGDVIGELALITGLPRQADVKAIAYCSLLRLSSRDFAEFLNTEPRLRADVEAIAEERLRANAASTPTARRPSQAHVTSARP